MGTEQNKDILDFKKLLATWRAAYRWATCSFLAIKTEGKPKLLVGRIILEPGIVPINSQPFRLDTDQIMGSRQTIQVSQGQLDEVLNEAVAGRIAISTEKIPLPESSSSFSFSPLFSPIYHPSVSFGPRLPSLSIRGGPKEKLLSATNFRPYENFDWSLKAADQPFDSLHELLMYLNLPGLMQLGDSTLLELIAGSPALVSNTSRITGGQADIRCFVALGLDTKKVKLGYLIPRKDSAQRSYVMGDKFQWKNEDNIQVGSIQVPVGDAQLILTFLSYDGIALHQWWVDDPLKRLNPRHAIHETFDVDLKLLERFLFTQEKDSRTFEHGVALLLHSLGFAVSHHGTISKLEQGPDIIAITPLGHVGVVECTTGLLDQEDKLAKLVQRTRAIRKKLEATGHGHLTIQPVIVSQFTKKEVEAHVEEAGKNGIAVVCKEDLENLFKNDIKLPPNPESIFQRAVQSVPRSDQRSLFPQIKPV